MPVAHDTIAAVIGLCIAAINEDETAWNDLLEVTPFQDRDLAQASIAIILSLTKFLADIKNIDPLIYLQSYALTLQALATEDE